MKLYIATSAKHKSELFTLAKLKHEMIKGDFEEYEDSKDPYTYVKMLSLGKAYSTINLIQEGVIVGLDTVVLINNKICEKPKSKVEARQKLKDSAKNISKVITGITLIDKYQNRVINAYSESLVTLKSISEEELDFYISNEPNVLNAAGYIIETVAACFIEKIEGSYYNIIGSPVETVYLCLKKLGYSFNDLE